MKTWIVVLSLIAMNAGANELDIAAQCPDATAEQISQARKIIRYFKTAEARFFNNVQNFNVFQTKTSDEFEYDDAWYGVEVARGDVIAKAGFMKNTRTEAAPPFFPKPCFHRYIDVNVHPITPFVGFMHSTIHFALNEDGTSQVGGTMLLVPAVSIEEDITRIRSSVDKAFRRYGMDVERYRQGVCSGYRKTNLQVACAGASFYQPPGLEVNARNVDLVIATYEAMVNQYFRALDRRKGQRYTEADLAERDAMRLRWFKDQLAGDHFLAGTIPWDVWTLANQAPQLRF